MFPMVSSKIEYQPSEGNYGRFVVAPLESGFGTTMGNALRRTLLSSLPGVAVTSVKIEEVEHEFSTIPHMREDTTEFLLNVKELRLRALSNRPGKLSLEMKGQGKVTAADIKTPPDFEVINPELTLATLTDEQAKLTVELQVEHGKGYIPAGRSDGQAIGIIPVDAIFTPVHKVNYAVENTRVGQVTNYDRLTLEVWTDGTITPLEAVSQSARILIEHFTLFSQLEKTLEGEGERQAPRLDISTEQFNTAVEALALSVRTLNCLRRANITKVGELLEKTEDELMTIRNFGLKSLEEVRQRLEAFGFKPNIKSPEERAAANKEEAPQGEKEEEEMSLPKVMSFEPGGDNEA